MTDRRASDRDVDRAIRSWLHEDRHEDASRVAGAVLDRAETTPQRRSTWWPARRTPTMNKFLTVGLGAAAVVVVLLVGAQLLASPSGPNLGGPPSDSPTPVPTSTAVPSAAGPPADFAAHPRGALVAGDYAFTNITGLQIVFTVDNAWEKNIPNNVVWTVEDDKATVSAFTVDNLYADPCQPDLGLLDPPLGPTVDDLATALQAVPGMAWADPVPVTQDGASGVRLDLVLPTEFGAGCGNPEGDVFLGTTEDGDDIFAPQGDESDAPIALFIYDVDGTRVVILAEYTAFRTEEIDALLASIRFE